MLNISDQKTIGRLLERMSHYSLHRPLLYQALLSGLTDICDMKGPSSILRIANLNQANTRFIGKPAHINFSTLEDIAFKALWSKYIKKDKNPIFKAGLLRHKQSNKLIDFATGTELLDSINYHKTNTLKNKLFDKLAANSNIGELGYIWFMPQPDFAWVVCLRRRKSEGPFTEHHRLLLQHFCHTAQGNLGNWYTPLFDILDASLTKLKDALTERQFETLHNLSQHYSRKECAQLMGVSNATVSRNVENLLAIFREHSEDFDKKTISQIIRTLRNEALATPFTEYSNQV